VLAELGSRSDADAGTWASVEVVADSLALGEQTVRDHLAGLESCELARTAPDGTARITVTGEELLALDIDEMMIVDSKTTDRGCAGGADL